eukprot:Colp12_sorted_trinity150504_noHs@31866
MHSHDAGLQLLLLASLRPLERASRQNAQRALLFHPHAVLAGRHAHLQQYVHNVVNGLTGSCVGCGANQVLSLNAALLRGLAACLAGGSLAQVDHHTPAPLHSVAGHAHHAARLQEGDRVHGLHCQAVDLIRLLLQQAGHRLVLPHRLLLRNLDRHRFFPQFSCLALKLRCVALLLKLVEGGADEVLRVRVLHSQHVQHHVVADVVRTEQGVGRSVNHVLGNLRLHFLVQHLDDNSLVVLASASGAATHLNVLARGDPAEVLAVELARLREDNGLGRHVDADGESLGGKQALDEALLEEQLNDFFEDGQQPSVVNAHAVLQQGQDGLHRRQLLVVLGQ